MAQVPRTSARRGGRVVANRQGRLKLKVGTAVSSNLQKCRRRFGRGQGERARRRRRRGQLEMDAAQAVRKVEIDRRGGSEGRASGLVLADWLGWRCH